MHVAPAFAEATAARQRRGYIGTLETRAHRAILGYRLPALIERFGGAQVIAFAAQFAVRRRRSRALLARTRLGFGRFLPLAREAYFPDSNAGATGSFGATLATVGFAFVGVSFSAASRS